METNVKKEFEGKTALITGASAGIGRATARLLASQGADVILVDIDSEGLLRLKEELSECGVAVDIYTCDVSCEERVNEIAKEVLSTHGKLDILINNAGIFRNDNIPFVEQNSDIWRRKIDVNIMGTLYFTYAFLPSMIERRYGKIINLASVAGKYGIAKMADYSLTKGAIIAFSKALAREVADKNVLVNTVSPGNIGEGYHSPSALAYMDRNGTPSEVAELICFIASDRASYLSGEDYVVDGCRKKI